MRAGLWKLASKIASRMPIILRLGDQAVVAAGTLSAVLATVGVWLASGGLSGRLCELGDRPRQSAAFQVDINTASLAELDLLPNIGPARGQQIIAERQKAPFTSADDVARRIKGIGPKIAAGMKPYLRPMGDQPARPVTPLGHPSVTASSESLARGATRPPAATLRPGRASE